MRDGDHIELEVLQILNGYENSDRNRFLDSGT